MFALYCVFCSYVQDLQPQLRVFMVQNPLQSKVHPQQQRHHKRSTDHPYSSSDPLHPCPALAVALRVCLSTLSRHNGALDSLNLFSVSPPFLRPRIECNRLHKWFRQLPEPLCLPESGYWTYSSCHSHPEGQGHLH